MEVAFVCLGVHTCVYLCIRRSEDSLQGGSSGAIQIFYFETESFSLNLKLSISLARMAGR